MIVRCTSKLLNLLGRRAVTLVDAPPDEDDWYANLLWLDRRKCLLVVHAGTLFPIFVADIRVSDLLPIESCLVGLVEGALLEEGLPVDALGRLDPDEVRLAKTVSRHVLGVMNQMAFEIGWHADQAGGLWNTTVDELNHHLRRSLHTKDGDYRAPSNLCTNGSSDPDAHTGGRPQPADRATPHGSRRLVATTNAAGRYRQRRRASQSR